MSIAREEIFGPVLAAITRARTPRRPCGSATASIYGLAAAVWTRDITRAHRIARALRAGMVYVNCYDADDITVPFGGFKQSGTGRDKSLHAFDKYTELKTTWIDLSHERLPQRHLRRDRGRRDCRARDACSTQTEIEALVLVSGDIEPFHVEEAGDTATGCSASMPSASAR